MTQIKEQRQSLWRRLLSAEDQAYGIVHDRELWRLSAARWAMRLMLSRNGLVRGRVRIR